MHDTDQVAEIVAQNGSHINHEPTPTGSITDGPQNRGVWATPPLFTQSTTPACPILTPMLALQLSHTASSSPLHMQSPLQRESRWPYISQEENEEVTPTCSEGTLMLETAPLCRQNVRKASLPSTAHQRKLGALTLQLMVPRGATKHHIPPFIPVPAPCAHPVPVPLCTPCALLKKICNPTFLCTPCLRMCFLPDENELPPILSLWAQPGPFKPGHLLQRMQ